MSNIQNILYENEKILWQGKPEKGPYIAGGLLSAIPICMFGFFFAAIIVVFFFLSKNAPMHWAIFFFPHFWIGIALMVFPFFNAVLSYSRLSYALTDKRAIIEHGIISHTISSIDYDQLSDASVTSSLVDQWYKMNTGSILFTGPAGTANVMNLTVRVGAGGSYVPHSSFQHIKDPYSVFKFMQKTEFDVKSDIQYPNALRPDTNTGYKTDYQNPPAPK